MFSITRGFRFLLGDGEYNYFGKKNEMQASNTLH